MSSVKKAFLLASYNVRLAITDIKFILIILAITFIIHDYTKDIISFSIEYNCKISIWLFPLLFNQKYMRRIIYIGVLFIFCDAPLTNNNYYYFLLRSGKKVWITGQFLYIFFMSGLYYIIIFLAGIITNCTHINFMHDINEWGAIFETLGSGYNIGYKTYTSNIIIKYFTPIQASWFTFILNFFSASFIGLLTCYANMVIKEKTSGVFVSTIIVLLDSLAPYYPKLIFFSLATWSNLECIQISKSSNLPSINYVITAYSILIIATIISAYIFYQREKTELN